MWVTALDATVNENLSNSLVWQIDNVQAKLISSFLHPLPPYLSILAAWGPSSYDRWLIYNNLHALPWSAVQPAPLTCFGSLTAGC